MSRFRFRLEKILAWERTQRDVEEAKGSNNAIRRLRMPTANWRRCAPDGWRRNWKYGDSKHWLEITW